MEREDVYNDLKTLDAIVLADNYENRFINSLYDISYVLNKIGISSCVIERFHKGIKIKNTFRNCFEYLLYNDLNILNEDDCIAFLGDTPESYYNEIKKIVDTRDDMYHFIFYECGNTKAYVYFNKNKCKMQIDLCSSTWGCIDNIKHFYYDIMLCNKDKDNLKFFTFWNLHISKILNIIKNLNCDKETRNDYYIKLIKMMNTENKFQALLSDVKDFEDKMLLLDIYQQYGGTI